MARKPKTAIDLGFLETVTRSTDMSGMFAASLATAAEMQQATLVPISLLRDNPFQPRTQANRESLAELTAVIKSQGFQGVLIARPHPDEPAAYQITAGHRRRDAARRAGLFSLPVVIHDLTDEEMVTLAITENIQREDLSPLEEGRIYLLMSDEMGFTHEQIAREVGKKRGYVENRIRVARAPRDVQKLVEAKPDSLRAVATLIKVHNPRDRAEVIEHLLSGELTVDDLRGYIEARSAMRQAERVIDEVRALMGDEFVDSARLMAQDWDGEPVQDEEQARHTGRRQPHAEPGRKANGGSGVEAGSTDHRSAARIGGAKLAAVVRYLSAYREAAGTRQGISPQERAQIATIRALADEIYQSYTHTESGLPS